MEKYQIHWVSNMNTQIEKDGFLYGNNKEILKKEAIKMLKKEMVLKRQTGRYFLYDLSLGRSSNPIEEKVI